MISLPTNITKCNSVIAAMSYIKLISYINSRYSADVQTRITEDSSSDTRHPIRGLDVSLNHEVREPSDSFLRMLSFAKSPTEAPDELFLVSHDSIPTFSVDDKPLQELLASGLWHRPQNDFSGTPDLEFNRDVKNHIDDSSVFTVIPVSLFQSENAAIKKVYEQRIADLRIMASEEDFAIAEASIKDFWEFFSDLSPSQEATLTLYPNENLRAVWDDEYGNHVGIQFRGAGVYQYVIFKGPKDSPDRIYDAGRDDIGVVMRLVKDYNLESLLGIYGG